MLSDSLSTPVTVNLDSTINNKDSTVKKDFSFGTYEVELTNGAWWAWGYPHSYPGYVTKYSDGSIEYGWLSTYAFKYTEENNIEQKKVSSNMKYATEEEATAGADMFIFTLAQSTTVEFWIPDFPINDNSGSIELTVSDISNNPVPEPTTILLFGTGIAGLAAVRRKRK